MATKSVTLKDSNGDTLYPVTDSNVVNINQQKTLAQALDGVVYAEDPTQNATPTGWVTSSDINWTSVGGMLMYVARFPIHKQTYNNGYLVFDAPFVFVQVDTDVVVTRVNNDLNLQFDLPSTGIYVTHISTQLWTGGNSWDYMLLEVRKNGDGFTRVMAPKVGGAWGFCATQGWQSVVDGDYISEYLNTNGNNFSDGNMSARDSYIDIVIYRVG